jgi:hypothetical protein
MKWLALLAALPCGAQTLSVCEALSRLTELNGQVISVRGVWMDVDKREVLIAEAPCAKPVIHDGWQWREWISLVPLKGAMLPGRDRDRRSDLLKKNRGSVALATVTGKLETQAQFTIRVDREGGQMPAAYGGLVAQLRFERAAELAAVPGETIPVEVRQPNYVVKPVE